MSALSDSKVQQKQPAESVSSEPVSDFALRVAEDGMTVLLDCAVPKRGWEDLIDQIQGELTALGVFNKLDSGLLSEKLLKSAGGAPLKGELLLEGVRPIPQRDGTIEWARDFFTAAFVVDEKTDRIDYRRRLDHRTVEECELIARLFQPQKGKDGRDVFGNRIHVDLPKRDQLKSGDNVREEKQEGQLVYYATATGRIQWESDTLSVSEIYSISDNVGLTTGDIEYPGNVEIHGDVENGSKVIAGGDIEIHGMLDAADIEAKGDLIVHGGINSDEGRHVHVGGNVHAKFIQNANMMVGGDVDAEIEILHSTIQCGGAIRLPTGRLLGGSASALMGLVVGQAGAQSHIRTVMTTGFDPFLEPKIAEREQRIEQNRIALKKIHRRIDPLVDRMAHLSARQRADVERIQGDLASLEDKIGALEREIEKIRAESEARSKNVIRIERKLYPECNLCYQEWEQLTQDSSTGPIKIVIENGKFNHRNA